MAEIGRVLLGILLVLIIFGGVSYIRAYLTRRAILRVIEIFYEHDALRMNSAKTLHELGLERPDLFQRMTRPRDYKQHALQVLMKRDIIIMNEDGKLYMLEEKLDQNLRNKSKTDQVFRS